MSTVGEVLGRLLPSGSRPYRRRGDWSLCPEWPPDVFAASATVLEQSGLYAHDRYSGRAASKGLFGKNYRDGVREAASTWRSRIRVPPQVRKDWETLVAAWDTPLARVGSTPGKVGDATVRLVTTSDEACAGMGFHVGDWSSTPNFAHFAFAAHDQYVQTGDSPLPYLPNSLCVMVRPEEACVQPKTRTSQLGCNARCLTHHLALLPASPEVETEWHFAHPAQAAAGPLNLLLVPFPYSIPGEAFQAGRRIVDESRSAHFTVDQSWLRGKGGATPARLGKFAVELLDQARREVAHVHGVVFPELSLTADEARRLSAGLAKAHGLELFVAGAHAPGKRARNQVYSSTFVRGVRLHEWYQSKHHRWMLDGPQIRRYNLGHVLDPAMRWWEEIDVSGRSVKFTVFRPGVSICTLVCEDLARLDPVHPVLRSVGPNLVICLLMDGPQLERRWPGRYATGLAEDPGSAVLTFSCLGMVRRSSRPGGAESRQVALWKEPGGEAQELALPDRAHGLLLTLNSCEDENWTLDGRSDGRATENLSLGAVHALRHPAPPDWAR